jgi:hypothetical protein
MFDYSALAWLTQGPHQMTPQLEAKFNEVSDKPFWFVFWGGGPKGWVKDMEQSQLRFSAVIQANECLFDPAQAEMAPAVMLYIDDAQAADSRWAEAFSGQIAKAFEQGMAPEISAQLQDPDSEIDTDVPTNLTGGVRARLAVAYLSPSRLPNGHIPANRVLPTLQHGTNFSVIPPAWYGAASPD